MFNPLLILYLFLVAGFLVSALVIVFHLWTYRMNYQIAFFTIVLFLLGVLALLAINFSIAIKIPWDNFRFFTY